MGKRNALKRSLDLAYCKFPPAYNKDEPAGGRVVYEGRNKQFGEFSSYKSKTKLPFSSRLEEDFLTVTCTNPRVKYVLAHPAPIVWYDGREWRAYQPDYALVLEDGVLDAAIKELDEVAREDIFEELQCIANAARRAGRNFKVFDERSIRVEPFLTNSRIVLSEARSGLFAPADVALVRQIAQGTRNFSVNDLVQNQVLPACRAFRTALTLVAMGELEIDMSKSIDYSSPIRLKTAHQGKAADPISVSGIANRREGHTQKSDDNQLSVLAFYKEGLGHFGPSILS
jgi:hypothetical protein